MKDNIDPTMLDEAGAREHLAFVEGMLAAERHNAPERMRDMGMTEPEIATVMRHAEEMHAEQIACLKAKLLPNDCPPRTLQ